MARAGSARDHLLAPATAWAFNQSATLALADFSDDAIRDARRLDTVHDQPNDASRPPRGMPLKRDRDEGVSGK
jgi:hypothetical protein